MQPKWWNSPGQLIGAVVVTCIIVALSAQPSESQENKPKGTQPSASEIRADERARVPVALARDRAKIMQEIYASTLNVMHHRYFHGDRTIVPARAMEEIFSDMKLETRAQAKWISVNTKAMNIDHEPNSTFEKYAAKEIEAGKSDVEIIEEGYYRRAVAIRLTDGCIRCHENFFKEPTKTPKFSVLVVSMPVHSDVVEPEKR
ncbi:MAG: hypothetical protein JWM11_7902 [Planctomycetaceae bacterium]|nr:hypothetical protein [Planctomycetaceae bacterium]